MTRTNQSMEKKKTESGTEKTDWWLPRGRGVGRSGVGVWGQQIQTSV